MGKLTYDFTQNRRKYFIVKHQFSKKSNDERQNRIIKFLRFCESKQIKKMNDIGQKHYDQFIQSLDVSSETARKYAIAVKEFCKRAHLDVKINPARAKKRKTLKKTDSIIQEIKKYVDIDDTIIEQIRSKIEKIL